MCVCVCFFIFCLFVVVVVVFFFEGGGGGGGGEAVRQCVNFCSFSYFVFVGCICFLVCFCLFLKNKVLVYASHLLSDIEI